MANTIRNTCCVQQYAFYTEIGGRLIFKKKKKKIKCTIIIDLT